jgi:cell shape-determining protein MreC
MSDPVGAVLANDFKKPFMVLVAVISTVVVIVAGLSKFESMVDERIDIKLAAQKVVADDHEKRLTKIEEKLSSMTEVLAEIRADVKVLRAQSERK